MALKRNHKDDLKNKKYRNWVKAGLSLKYLKDGIGDFADECAKFELDRILRKLGLPSGSSCKQCSLTTLRPSHVPPRKAKQCPIGQRHCNCLQNNTTSCSNNICGRIYDEIVDSHGTRSPNWKSTDITKWTTNPWEIAKCFINAQGYETTRSASDTDVAGLLRLFINSTGFQGHVLCAISLFDKIRVWRNSLFHSPTMELEDQTLADGINDIITFLNDGKELKEKECSKQAIHKLIKLQQENFIITTETEAEVCRTALASITQITEEQRSIHEEANRDIIEAKKDISLRQEDAKKEISLRLEDAKKEISLMLKEAKKDIFLRQEEAKKDICLRQEEAVIKVQDAADTCSSLLQTEVSELRDTVKTHELEIQSFKKIGAVFLEKAGPRPGLMNRISSPKASDLDSDLQSLTTSRRSLTDGHSRRYKSEHNPLTEVELNERITRKMQHCARKQQKQQEQKRLRQAQDIQRKIQEVDVKQRELEERGVSVERALRGEGPEGGRSETELVQEWFNLLREKNGLVRLESELMVSARELELEDRQGRLQHQLRESMAVDDSLKSPQQREREQRIYTELIELVEERDTLVAMLEEERVRMREENKDLENVMKARGFSLSPTSGSKLLRQTRNTMPS